MLINGHNSSFLHFTFSYLCSPIGECELHSPHEVYASRTKKSALLFRNDENHVDVPIPVATYCRTGLRRLARVDARAAAAAVARCAHCSRGAVVHIVVHELPALARQPADAFGAVVLRRGHLVNFRAALPGDDLPAPFCDLWSPCTDWCTAEKGAEMPLLKSYERLGVEKDYKL